MTKSPKKSKSKPKPTSSFENIIDRNRARNQALKKLLRFIEGNEANGKGFTSKPKHESNKPT